MANKPKISKFIKKEIQEPREKALECSKYLKIFLYYCQFFNSYIELYIKKYIVHILRREKGIYYTL